MPPETIRAYDPRRDVAFAGRPTPEFYEDMRRLRDTLQTVANVYGLGSGLGVMLPFIPKRPADLELIARLRGLAPAAASVLEKSPRAYLFSRDPKVTGGWFDRWKFQTPEELIPAIQAGVREGSPFRIRIPEVSGSGIPLEQSLLHEAGGHAVGTEQYLRRFGSEVPWMPGAQRYLSTGGPAGAARLQAASEKYPDLVRYYMAKRAGGASARDAAGEVLTEAMARDLWTQAGGKPVPWVTPKHVAERFPDPRILAPFAEEAQALQHGTLRFTVHRGPPPPMRGPDVPPTSYTSR